MGIKKYCYIKKVKRKLNVIFKIIDIRPISFYIRLKILKKILEKNAKALLTHLY